MKRTRHINDNSVIAMKNNIITTIANLSVTQSRLFQYILAHYDSRDGKNYTYETTVKELKEFFGVDYQATWTVVKAAMKQLGSMPLEWREGNAQHFDNWFTGVTYFAGSGKMQFRINKDAEPFFLKLKSFFTCYRLGATKKFTKAASFKLYLNLSQWANMTKWDVDLDELKYRLGVVEKYPAYKDFRRWILDPAVEEINEHSDLLVDYIPTKENRWVVGLLFRIKRKTDVRAAECKQLHETNKMLDEGKNDTENDNYIKPLFGQMFLDDVSEKTNRKRGEP